MHRLPAAVVTIGVPVMRALAASLIGCSTPLALPDSASAWPARQRAIAVRYPTELIGRWVTEGTDCPAPDGEYVGDRILEIQPDRLVAHEEVRAPIDVTRESNGTSWRINALVDMGPSGLFEPDVPATYGLEHGALTIEHGGRTERYRYCPDP